MELTTTDKVILMEARLKDAIAQCKKARRGILGDFNSHLMHAKREAEAAVKIADEILKQSE